MNELVFHVLASAVGEPIFEKQKAVKILFTEVSSPDVALSVALLRKLFTDFAARMLRHHSSSPSSFTHLSIRVRPVKGQANDIRIHSRRSTDTKRPAFISLRKATQSHHRGRHWFTFLTVLYSRLFQSLFSVCSAVTPTVIRCSLMYTLPKLNTSASRNEQAKFACAWTF